MNVRGKLLFLSLQMIAVLSTAGMSITDPVRAQPVPVEPVDGRIDWVFDYDQAKRLADAAGKPLMVVFRCER